MKKISLAFLVFLNFSSAFSQEKDKEKEQNGELNEIVVVGTRTAPRSNTTSALPVDVLTAKDLTSTGQSTFDKALQYKIPSFNTVQTPVNDATSLLDPYEIRNMGPSRTLILINGKRKNMSSLVYTQTSPGRGETGADISAIPTDAIERVEILRDGASAQYGSDAIAGVMNIILKKSTKGASATLRSGITGKGDGEMFGLSLNNGTKVGEKGFVNYTVDFSKVALAQRSGKVSADGEFNTFVYTDPNNYKSYTRTNNSGVTTLGGTVINGLSDTAIDNLFNTYKTTAAYPVAFSGINTDNTNGRAAVDAFLKESPDAGNINGAPETLAAKFQINGGDDLSETTQLYYNAAYVYKKINSFANYRTPYWRSASSMPYLASLYGNGTAASYKGYVPTFIGDLNDYNATLGLKNKVNGWNSDASITFGGNSQTYTVANSQNRTKYDKDNDGFDDTFVYAQNSNVYTGQTTFKPGGTSFDHIVGNVDISKAISDKISIGFGSEFRTENFEILAGDFQSYDGSGADSFQGNRPENSGKNNRYNLGFYADVAVDFTENILANATFRNENYSDFGTANVWKLSGRWKTSDDKFTLRGSASTGFRAPSLHQIYTEKAQSTFSSGVIAVTGIVSNVSSTAKALGVPQLKPEKSVNVTLGFGFKPSKDFSLTLDFYSIKVTDRVVLGNLVNNLAYFTNALDSKTEGFDYVLGYKNITVGQGKLALNLSGNVTTTNKRIGAVKNPASVPAGQTVFNATQEALMFTSRPVFKVIFGANYEVGKFGLSLNNTTFGPTTFKQESFSNPGLYTEFSTAQVTDLGVNYSATKDLTFALNINNILNVIPKYTIKSDGSASANAIVNNPASLRNEDLAITFNGRYDITTYDGSQFSQLGRLFNLSMNYRF